MRDSYITLGSLLDQDRTTCRVATDMIQAWCAHPRFVALARRIAEEAGAQSAMEEAAAMWRWVRGMITYRQDPAGHEYLQDPVQTLYCRVGDCDDQATLVGTLLAAIGHPCSVVGVVWKNGIQPTHAVCLDSAIDSVVDPVANTPPGQWPPSPWVFDHFVEGW